MSHPDGELLSALADGELAADESAAVRGHLQQCPACRAELAGLESVRRAVRWAMVPALPDSFERELLQSGAASVALRRRAAVAVAAVAAAVATVAIAAFPREPSTAPRVGNLVETHLMSTSGADPSRVAPAAIPVSLHGP